MNRTDAMDGCDALRDMGDCQMKVREARLWACVKELAIMLDRDPDGIEEIAIEKNLDALCEALGVDHDD